MTAGESFGELALLENRPRAATILCKEDCDFAILEKEQFNEILKENERKKLFLQIDFFAKMKMFEAWSYNAIKRLYLVCDQKRYCKGDLVYGEGEEAFAVYLIKNGEFNVIS